MRPPSPAARIGLALANLAGGALCGLAAARVDQALLEPVRLLGIGLAVSCLAVGVPGGLSTHPGLRSVGRALAAVGLALGAAANVILRAAAG